MVDSWLGWYRKKEICLYSLYKRARVYANPPNDLQIPNNYRKIEILKIVNDPRSINVQSHFRYRTFFSKSTSKHFLTCRFVRYMKFRISVPGAHICIREWRNSAIGIFVRTEKSATLLWSVDQYSLILQAQLHLSRLDPHPLIGNLLQVWGGGRRGWERMELRRS